MQASVCTACAGKLTEGKGENETCKAYFHESRHTAPHQTIWTVMKYYSHYSIYPFHTSTTLHTSPLLQPPSSCGIPSHCTLVVNYENWISPALQLNPDIQKTPLTILKVFYGPVIIFLAVFLQLCFVSFFRASAIFFLNAWHSQKGDKQGWGREKVVDNTTGVLAQERRSTIWLSPLEPIHFMWRQLFHRMGSHSVRMWSYVCLSL